MKKLLLLFLLSSTIMVFGQTHNYIIKGKIGNLNKPATVFLLFNDTIFNAATLHDGAFTFEGTIAHPTQAYLSLNKKGNNFTVDNYVQFYVESGGIIQVQSPDSLAKAKITGTKTNDEYNGYKALMAPYERRDSQLETRDTSATEAQKSSATFLRELELANKTLEKERRMANAKYITNHPGSLISLDALQSFATFSDYNAISALYNKLSAEVKNSPQGKAYAQTLDNMSAVGLGKIAPDFELPDTNARPVKLSSFRGKYLLLDFWASWCPVCRESSPGVLKAYKQYEDKNFTVLSVSLDKAGDKKAWLNAIHHDGLLWTQVSDLKFWQSPIVNLYKLTAIPQNFLLDPDGKIIARDLDSNELPAKLAEIFKQ